MSIDPSRNHAPPSLRSWSELFGNDHPVELEIGVGKGNFLVRRAMAHPERNFFGIEWANEFYKIALDRIERRGLSNARVIRADARQFMLDLCPRDSLLCLHIYHPDPWPKKRHNRRRLIQAPFLECAVERLLPPGHATIGALPPTPGLPSGEAVGGRLAIQTDHAEYFEQIRAVIAAQPRLRAVEFNDPAWLAGVPEFALRDEGGEGRVRTSGEVRVQSVELKTDPGAASRDEGAECDSSHSQLCTRNSKLAFGAATNFEIKYRREGRPIYQLACVRVG